ncbi:hypothetical protein ANO11243_032350 [Dothideomycetidae sp. 11243]|nr:hypothetical protein ANO11243_032350 [fungal sp. No.11243]
MATTTTAPPLSVIKRPWSARGHADHDWLYTFHTFSFASYQSAQFQSFGPLRVINEDRVAPGTGFGAHPHREFHIWSYIVSGELEHNDSLGNRETLKRGDVQFTCAGTGIRHSETNEGGKVESHFLQIWARPSVAGLKPRYETKTFGDGEKTDRLCRIVESVDRLGDRAAGPIGIEADVSMDASILSPEKTVTHRVVAEGERKVYFHVVMSGRTQPKTGGARIRVGNETLGEGDGAFVQVPATTRQIEVESVGDTPAEFLLFDMGLD